VTARVVRTGAYAPRRACTAKVHGRPNPPDGTGASDALSATSETSVVFRDDADKTLGTIFYDSNHCRDWAGVPEDEAMYVLVNMGVVIDQAKLDAAVALPEVTAPSVDPPAQAEPPQSKGGT